jgi:drug/metabolite transporter (DMT)-like permease
MLSIVLLGEAMAPSTAAGAVLILAASFIGAFEKKEQKA